MTHLTNQELAEIQRRLLRGQRVGHTRLARLFSELLDLRGRFADAAFTPMPGEEKVSAR